MGYVRFRGVITPMGFEHSLVQCFFWWHDDTSIAHIPRNCTATCFPAGHSLWPFWDGENVTLSRVFGDLQRLGIKKSLWITWQLSFYNFTKKPTKPRSFETFFLLKRCQAAVILKLPRLADMEVGEKRVVFSFQVAFSWKNSHVVCVFLWFQLVVFCSPLYLGRFRFD